MRPGVAKGPSKSVRSYGGPWTDRAKEWTRVDLDPTTDRRSRRDRAGRDQSARATHRHHDRDHLPDHLPAPRRGERHGSSRSRPRSAGARTAALGSRVEEGSGAPSTGVHDHPPVGTAEDDAADPVDATHAGGPDGASPPDSSRAGHGSRSARRARARGDQRDVGRPGPPLTLVSLVASLASGLAVLGAVPGQLDVSLRSGLVLAAAAVAQMSGAGLVLWRRRRLTLTLAAVGASAVPVLWLLTRPLGVLHAPALWISLNDVVGVADVVVAVLGAAAAAGFTLAASYGRIRPATLGQRVGLGLLRLLGAATVAVLALVAVTASVGSLGRAFASTTSFLYGLPAGQTSTVRYCAPDGVPLLMDLHMPGRQAGPGLHPAVLYLHGGGLMVGDRAGVGMTGALASLDDPLFTPVTRGLTSRGIIVASIDYRLIPNASWPAPVDDAECAVRFLREHAADLGVDGRRIAVWGHGAGGTLASLVGLAKPGATAWSGGAGTSDGPRPSGTQAVVDVSGVSDFTRMGGASLLVRAGSWLTVGADPASASPMAHVTKGSAPPFLLVTGTDPQRVPHSQATRFADRLDAAGLQSRVLTTAGADRPGATSAAVATKVIDFLSTSLASVPPAR